MNGRQGLNFNVNRVRCLLQGSLVLTLTSLSSVLPLSAGAIQLADGTVYFARPPLLDRATVDHKGAGSIFATYYFTLTLPPDAGEPLQRVTLAQHQGTENIRFDLRRTTAYVGNQRKNRLPLAEVIQDPQTRIITVTFDPPVAAGTTVTIALEPIQNPLVGGVYLFGVTAYPQGEKSHGQFLGYGRLQFYGDDFFWGRFSPFFP
uniref:DUF2808 domain-containing protein n=1 Tax=Cyanothece sp. (strain PCC 7425 / ATCC 29141) TaxID=395961 RepID=B8HTQ9_CYAP4